jgi:F-type H+-transporting ATPase subunit b
MSRRRILLLLAVLPALVFLTTGEREAAGNPLDFAGRVVNFLVLAGGLGFLLFKPLRSFLARQGKNVATALAEAEEARREAGRKYEAARGKLAGLDREARELRERAGEEARRERERIARLAAADAERVKRMTREEVELQRRAALKELRAHAAERLVALAEERLRRSLTAEDQARLVDASIERLSVMHEGSRAR